jgi:hypothetical protein
MSFYRLSGRRKKRMSGENCVRDMVLKISLRSGIDLSDYSDSRKIAVLLEDHRQTIQAYFLDTAQAAMQL